MAMQMTIVGLGQIGGSIGLALNGNKTALKRVGHDKKMDVEKAALGKGAVDEVKHNLPAAVHDANIVMLCLPLSQARGTLEIIGPELQEGAVVMDTAPVKDTVSKWAKELIPAGRYYIGLAPALNPEVLHDLTFGLDAAREDLFKQGVMVINAPYGTPGDVVQLASDLTELLGATPLLADLAESDGLMTSMHLLPQLVAAALLNATVDQPGWQEARKLAGRPYAVVTAGLAYQDEIDSLRMAVLQNNQNVVRLLDTFIASLRGLRDDIEKADDEGVAVRLEQALEGRNRWMSERLLAEWSEKTERKVLDVPSFAERFFGSAFYRRTPNE